MPDVIEVSYTGDILAHRRCPRAWSYESHAGFHPYEQVQAMEGRLAHHAMEWLTRFYDENGRHAKKDELRAQMEHYFRVLWSRGIKTAFASKQDTLDRISNNLYKGRGIHPTVKAAVEGAKHTEYELRAVRKLVHTMGVGGASKMMLTGVLDVVVQLDKPLRYDRTWSWTDERKLEGKLAKRPTRAKKGDLEIWDYKATKLTRQHLNDYVIQLLTYANLYRDRTGDLPKRCVIFYLNEPKKEKQMVAIEVNRRIIKSSMTWTLKQVNHLHATITKFQSCPTGVEGGELDLATKPPAARITQELRQQCTACGRRFDCDAYVGSLTKGRKVNKVPADVDRENVLKN